MLYEFGSQFTFENIPRGMDSTAVSGLTEAAPAISPYPTGGYQLSDVQGGRVSNLWEEHRVESADIEEFIEPGFRYLDSGMKNYWQDIRVPSKDGYRFARAKIAGMRNSLQIWTEELKHGRVKLPVISISRTSHAYNSQKFTPPYGYMGKRFVNAQRTRAAAYFRPIPYNVEYTMSIWAEHKRDAEYILYQVLTRFNPLAELRVSDGHSVGNVQMKLNSSSDSSDKEATSEQYAKVKYEIAYTAEAWLSIPERVMPTILGHVASIREKTSGVGVNMWSNRA